MPGPTITFGFILATLIGALFHLVLGGDARRLALFLLASWVGFALGQLVGEILRIDRLLGLFSVGPLHLLPAGMGAVAAALFSHVVTSDRRGRRQVR